MAITQSLAATIRVMPHADDRRHYRAAPVPGTAWPPRGRPWSAPAAAGVGDAAGLDLPGVDRGLLVRLPDPGQAREEVGPIAEELPVEPCVELGHDVLARVHALPGRPVPKIAFPRQPGRAPLVVTVPQPV